MKEIFLHSPKKYIIALFLAIAFFIVYMISQSIAYPDSNQWLILFNYVNAFSIPGMILICIGGLSTVNNFGAFDIFNYLLVKHKYNYHSLSDFSNDKDIYRKKHRYVCVPYFAVGFIFLIISLILWICL